MPTDVARPAQIIDLPGWRPIARQVFTTLVLVSALPMTVFYLALSLYGLRAAALATVSLYYGALLVKVLRRKPILAAALLTAALLSIRTVVMFLTGSSFIYFLQPVAGTVALATVIAASALAGRPILDRLAHEFCPFPAELSTHLREQRFFSRLSAVWAVTYLINAVGTIWLLRTMSVGGFVVLKSFVGPALTITAVAASLLYFRVAMRNQQIHIRWRQRVAPAGAPAV
jgi:intracellular septation protein A